VNKEALTSTKQQRVKLMHAIHRSNQKRQFLRDIQVGETFTYGRHVQIF